MGIQDSVAAVGEKLSESPISPGVARPRAAVRKNHYRKIFGRNTLGQRQVGRDLQPIGRLVADWLHAGEILPRKLLPNLVLQRQFSGFAVEQIGLTRLRIGSR